MRAWLRGDTLHFDKTAWALIKKFAKESHKSPKQIVIAGLKRGTKHAKGKEKRVVS
jgi:hypothetical protein